MLILTFCSWFQKWPITSNHSVSLNRSKGDSFNTSGCSKHLRRSAQQVTGCGWNCQDVPRILCFKFLKYIPSRWICQATIMLEKYFSQYFINLRLLTNTSIHKCSGNNVWQSITNNNKTRLRLVTSRKLVVIFPFKMTFKTDEFSS